jgi:hypothetical protein
MRYRTHLRIALWIASSSIGVVLALSGERDDAVLVSILFTFLVLAASWADHAIATRESRS